MIVEILLGLILLTNLTQLALITTILTSNDYNVPELNEEMRAKIYS